MPVCITGMHRAGTSMVARLLNVCGLFLGAREDLLPEAPDNPTGFWEHTGFLEINEQLLTHLGGKWNTPPATFPPGWIADTELIPIVEKARQLLTGFIGHNKWGWKDPRTSLTYPFWQKLVPQLKVVICVRSPLEVAQSLKQREIAGLLDSQEHWVEAAFKLWYQYYGQVWQNVPEELRLVTHYEAFFHDPQAELQRVLTFLEMPAQPRQLEMAAKTVQAHLYRQRQTFDGVILSETPLDVLQLYFELCEAAGPVFAQTDTAVAYRNFVDLAIAPPSMTATNLAVLWARAQAYCRQEEQLRRYQVEIARLQRQLMERESTLKMLCYELDLQAETIHTLTRRVTTVEKWQRDITSRFSWQILEKFWALREKVVPTGGGLDRIVSPVLAKFKRKINEESF